MINDVVLHCQYFATCDVVALHINHLSNTWTNGKNSHRNILWRIYENLAASRHSLCSLHTIPSFALQFESQQKPCSKSSGEHSASTAKFSSQLAYQKQWNHDLDGNMLHNSQYSTCPMMRTYLCLLHSHKFRWPHECSCHRLLNSLQKESILHDLSKLWPC